MADLTANIWGVVLILDHDETQEALKVPTKMAEIVPVAIERAIAAGIISATVFNPISVPIVITAFIAYFGVQHSLISACDKGGGVYLTLPWVAIALAAQGGVIALAAIIPGTRPWGLCNDWQKASSGQICTETGDIIAFTSDANVIANNEIGFVLNSDGPKWRKEIWVEDGQGNRFITVTDGPKRQEDRNGIWSSDAASARLVFRKAREFGVMKDVLVINDLDHLKGGDLVTFRWIKD